MSTTSVDLLAEIEAEVRGTGPQCSIATAITGNPELAEQIRKAVDGTYPATAITAALKKHGIHIGPEAIRRHRRKACHCD